MRPTLPLVSLVGLVALSTVALAEEGELATPARVIEISPLDPGAYDAFVQVAFRLHQWDAAIARLKEGTAKIPSYHLGWYKLAYAYRQKKDYANAIAAYKKFAELEPTRADTYFGLGAAMQGAGDRKGAIDAYKRYIVMEKSPDKLKFVEQAQNELEKLEATASPPVATPTPVATPRPTPSPTPPPSLVSAPAANAQSLRASGQQLRTAGKLDEAASAYEKALAADPGNLEVYVELGDVYFAQRRYGDAVRVFRSSVDKDAGYALGWYNLAHAQSRANDHGGAVQSYKQYIQLRPSDPDPFYGLGMAYKSSGDKKAAADAFRMYLQMEHRPESQKWVDKARRELDTIEGHTERRRDLKNPFEDGYASNDDLLPVGSDEVGRREHERIQREIAADDILPIEGEEGRGGKDPFAGVPLSGARDKLARYAVALAQYRAALDRQTADLTSLYHRGAERVIANDLRGAQRAWSAAILGDRSVEEARAKLEKARAALLAATATPAAHASEQQRAH